MGLYKPWKLRLRRAVNKQMTHAYGPNWHSKKLDETKLGRYLTEEIRDAKKCWDAKNHRKDTKNKESGKSDIAEANLLPSFL